MSTLININIVKNHIAIITLNRPEAANALSTDLLQELDEAILKVKQNSSIYCTIITGENDRAFCAGADLKERINMSDEQVIRAVTLISKVATNIEEMPMPVITAINGVAFGGGLELALASDLRIAAKHAIMGLTETSLAIIPGAGGTQRLARLIGLGQAKRLIFTAARLDAEEAFRIGLVEQVVDSDELLRKAIEMAHQIANNGPVAIRQAKSAIHQGYQTDLATGLAIEHECYLKTIPTKDRMEGLLAFKEKRKPEYKGR